MSHTSFYTPMTMHSANAANSIHVMDAQRHNRAVLAIRSKKSYEQYRSEIMAQTHQYAEPMMMTECEYTQLEQGHGYD